MLESEGSHEENDLIDGIRDILKKQKKNKDEDAYYDDLEHLLKNLNIPLHEKVEEMFNLMKIKTPSMVGTHRPKNIPCNLFPDKNKYSAIKIMRIQTASIRKFASPIFFKNII